MKRRQTKLQNYLDMSMWHSIYMAHHAGFVPLPWWKHQWIHIKLWISFKGWRIRRYDKKTNQTSKMQ